MRESILPYVALDNISILEALKKIDLNTHGFLIIVDNEERMRGVLTDGDIRRAIVNGASILDRITNIYNQSAKYVYIESGIDEITELFKSKRIKFLPVVDANGTLVNLITKLQMYSFLLQDLHIDLCYPFFTLDESLVDYEIYHRPWGFYRTTVMNEYFQSKVISVYPKARLSLQSHNFREEIWVIAHGSGIVQIGDSTRDARCGDCYFIPKGCKHRLTNTDEKESLIVTEVQLGSYFGEDDIVRYEDIYGRE